MHNALPPTLQGVALMVTTTVLQKQSSMGFIIHNIIRGIQAHKKNSLLFPNQALNTCFWDPAQNPKGQGWNRSGKFDVLKWGTHPPGILLSALLSVCEDYNFGSLLWIQAAKNRKL